MEGLYNKNEIKQILKIEASTFNIWKREGLPGLKVEGKDYFDLVEVQEGIRKLAEPIDNLKIGKAYSNQEISKFEVKLMYSKLLNILNIAIIMVGERGEDLWKKRK